MPSLAVALQARPRLKLTNLSLPCPDPPRPARPRDTTHHRALPPPAPPRPALARRARPESINLSMPRRAQPCHTSPNPALPRRGKPCLMKLINLSLPCLASPRLALPSPAVPGHASPRPAELRHIEESERVDDSHLLAPTAIESLLLGRGFYRSLLLRLLRQPFNHVEPAERAATFRAIVTKANPPAALGQKLIDRAFVKHLFVDLKLELGVPFVESRPVAHDSAFRRGNNHRPTINLEVLR